jgi:hypothetical protein
MWLRRFKHLAQKSPLLRALLGLTFLLLIISIIPFNHPSSPPPSPSPSPTPLSLNSVLPLHTPNYQITYNSQSNTINIHVTSNPYFYYQHRAEQHLEKVLHTTSSALNSTLTYSSTKYLHPSSPQSLPATGVISNQ